MLALPGPIPDPSGGTFYQDHKLTGSIIYLPPTWSLWPVQVAPEAGLKPESDAFFQHDHTAWKLIPADQAEKARLAGEVLLDQTLAFLTGQIDKSAFTNAHNEFFKKVQRLVRTGDDKPRSRPRVNPFQHIDTNQPIQGQQKAIEGKRLATVLLNLLGLEVAPACGTFRSGDYRYHLHPDATRGDGLDIERLRPDRSDYLVCMTPAYDRAGVEVAIANLKQQYDEITARSLRRFAHSDEVIIPGQIIVERGPIPDFNAAEPDGLSGRAADLIAQFNKDVYKAGETEFKRALGGMQHVKQ